jgi:hypothetical protein
MNRDKPTAPLGNSDEPPNDELKQDALLDDLESIRELLDEEREATSDDTSSVPLLDDMLDGALSLEEADLTAGRDALVDPGRPTSHRWLDDGLLDALLTDQWKLSAEAVLTQARGAIEAHRNEWTPDDTDELNQALRERIDATLTRWLRATISAHMEELRAELVQAAEDTINDRIALLIERRSEDDAADRRPADRGPDHHG